MKKTIKNWRLIVSCLIAGLLLWEIDMIFGINHFSAQLRAQTVPFYDQDDWLKNLKAAAEKQKVPAINARIDRVWKAIPGYNGLVVDLPKTIQLSKRSKSSTQIQFVFDETTPAINLDDLDPEPIYKGNPQKPMVSLMINVAWGNEFIPKMLEVLKKEHVHATFFFDGTWLSHNLSLAKQIQQDGNELSNHAYSHRNMSQLSSDAARQEIIKTQNLLENQLNVRNTLFAPPSGDFNQQTVQIAASLHLKTVLWTIDTVDWKNPQPAWIVQRVTKSLAPGSMILMHPTKSSSMALNSIIMAAKSKGLALGTVSELLSTARVPDATIN